MVDKLYFREHKSNKIWIILILIPIVAMFLIYIFNQITVYSFGTNPKEVLNYTQGVFITKPHSFMSFQEYYSLLNPQEEKLFYPKINSNDILENPKLKIVISKIESDNKSYDYEEKYYDSCKNKKVKINFTNPKYSEFKFNYSNKTFSYQVNLYADLYSFSDNLKNQDCYFSIDKYTEGYLEDPYNNMFLDAISKNFISLKQKGYSDDEIVEIATLFVQSIPYGTDYTGLNRYPYETIYENEGNCLDKSLILAGILKNIGYKYYIILGNSESEHHAIIGIVCNKGNVQYQGEEICFIETTAFTPIGSKIEINIISYISNSNGTLVYKDINYGKNLIDTFELKTKEAENIGSQLDSMYLELNSMTLQLEDQYDKMCKTDCTYCDNDRIDPLYCDDAYEFNRYLDEYNKIANEYNKIVKDYDILRKKWYGDYYGLEKLMFGNVEIVERSTNISSYSID